MLLIVARSSVVENPNPKVQTSENSVSGLGGTADARWSVNSDGVMTDTSQCNEWGQFMTLHRCKVKN